MVKFSPEREKHFKEVENNVEFADDAAEVVKLDRFCLTRWTVRAKCLAKVSELCGSLFTLIDDECIQEEKFSVDVKSRIVGCTALMKKFDFFFWCFSWIRTFR